MKLTLTIALSAWNDCFGEKAWHWFLEMAENSKRIYVLKIAHFSKKAVESTPKFTQGFFRCFEMTTLPTQEDGASTDCANSAKRESQLRSFSANSVFRSLRYVNKAEPE